MVISLSLERELLLIEGISLQGLGNWQAIAEHVGTRTKEEAEEHYNTVYVTSQDWPLPVSAHPLHPQLNTAYSELTPSAIANGRVIRHRPLRIPGTQTSADIIHEC